MKNKKLIISIGSVAGIAIITTSIVIPVVLMGKKDEPKPVDQDLRRLEVERDRLAAFNTIELPFDTVKDADGIETAIRNNQSLALTNISNSFEYSITVNLESNNFNISVSWETYGPLGPVTIGYTFAADPDLQLVNDEFSRLQQISLVHLPFGTGTSEEELNDALWRHSILNLKVDFNYTIAFQLVGNTFTIAVSKGNVPPTQPHTVSYSIADSADPDLQLVEDERVRISAIPELVLPIGTTNSIRQVEAAIRSNEVLALNNIFTYNIAVDVTAKQYSIIIIKGNVAPTQPIANSYIIAIDPDIQLVDDEVSRLEGFSSLSLPDTTVNTKSSVENAIRELDDFIKGRKFTYLIDVNTTYKTFVITVTKGFAIAKHPVTLGYTIQMSALEKDSLLVSQEYIRLSAAPKTIEFPEGTNNDAVEIEALVRANTSYILNTTFKYSIGVNTLTQRISIVITKGAASSSAITFNYTIAVAPIDYVELERERLDAIDSIVLPYSTDSLEDLIRSNITLALNDPRFTYTISISGDATNGGTFTVVVNEDGKPSSLPVSINFTMTAAPIDYVELERTRLDAIDSIVLPYSTDSLESLFRSNATLALSNPRFTYTISINGNATNGGTVSIIVNEVGKPSSLPVSINFTMAPAPIDYVELERARLDAIDSIVLPYNVTDSLESLIRSNITLALTNTRFTYTINISGNAANGGSFTIVVNETGKPSSLPVSINFTMLPNPLIAIVNERVSSLNQINARPIFAHNDVINEATILAKYTWAAPYTYRVTDLNTTAKTFTITVSIENVSAKTQVFSYFESADPQIELDYYVRNQVGITWIEDKLVSEYAPFITHAHSAPLDFNNLRPLDATVASNLGIDVTYADTSMDIEFFYFLSKSANETKENSAQYVFRIVGKHQLPNGNYIYSLRQNYELQSSDVLPLTGAEKAELDLGIITQWFQGKDMSSTIDVLDTKIQSTFTPLTQDFATDNNLGLLPLATNGSTYQYKLIKGPEQAGTNQTYLLTVKAVNGLDSITSGEIVILSTDVNAGPIDPSMELVSNERERFISEILNGTGVYDEKTLESVPVRGEKNPAKIMSAVFTPQNNVVVTYNTESVDANFEFAIIKVTFSLNGFSTSETYKVTFEKSEEIKEIVDEGKLLYRMKTQQLIYDPWKSKLPDKIVAADWAGLKLEDLIGTVDFDPSDPKYSYDIRNVKSFNNDDGTIVLGVTVRHADLAREYWTQVSIKGLMRTSQNRANIMRGYISGRLVNGEAQTNIQGANTKLPSQYTNEDFAQFSTKPNQPMPLDLSVSNLPLTGLTTQWTIVSADDATGKLYMRVIMRHGVDYLENNIIDVVLTGFKRA